MSSAIDFHGANKESSIDNKVRLTRKVVTSKDHNGQKMYEYLLVNEPPL